MIENSKIDKIHCKTVNRDSKLLSFSNLTGRPKRFKNGFDTYSYLHLCLRYLVSCTCTNSSDLYGSLYGNLITSYEDVNFL